jgi:hypothetical protein
MLGNKLMKKFLTILILIFTLQTPSQADDIRDFQIEGMSIGDSLLDYFSEAEIKENLPYKELEKKKFNSFELYDPEKFKDFDSVQVSFKNSDKNYKIYSIIGMIFFEESIEDCHNKKDLIVNELSKLFPNANINDKGISIHPADKSGKSKTNDYFFNFKSKDYVGVSCYDWDKKTEFTDNVRVKLITDEYEIFLRDLY